MHVACLGSVACVTDDSLSHVCGDVGIRETGDAHVAKGVKSFTAEAAPLSRLLGTKQ
jgi:hypothetical protein